MMILSKLILTVALSLSNFIHASAFQSGSAGRQAIHRMSSPYSYPLPKFSSHLFVSKDVEADPFEGMTEERKANLFQSLLRDLQIEGVPVLGCDANAVHTMSAALWTTMAEVSENDDDSKLCLVMESIPIGALKAFVEDFTVLKTQNRLMVGLKELKRLSVSLVGKGVGPALIIESSKRTEEELAEKAARAHDFDEQKCTVALQSFIDRIVVNEEACPYTKNVNLSATGLEKKGITPGPVAYRFNGSSDACAAVGMFWNCVCELLSKPQEEISTTMLSLPGIGLGTTTESLARFAAVVELISRNLCLFRGDDVFGLVHFHPAYDRSLINPIDKPAYGHLPPRKWLRPILKMNGNKAEADNLSDDDLALSDYQRKSPHTAINILRVKQLNAAAGAKSIVDLEISDGVFEKASGITTYSRNAIRLAKVGREALETGLQSDIAMLKM